MRTWPAGKHPALRRAGEPTPIGSAGPHLVQQDDLRGFEDGPGDRYPLLLSPAQLQPSLAHLRFVPWRERERRGATFGRGRSSLGARAGFCATFRERRDLVVYVGRQRGLLHLLVAGADAPVADVVLDGVVEKDGVLRNHADVGSQRRLLHLRGRRREPASTARPPVRLSLDLSRGSEASNLEELTEVDGAGKTLTFDISWPSMVMQPP